MKQRVSNLGAHMNFKSSVCQPLRTLVIHGPNASLNLDIDFDHYPNLRTLEITCKQTVLPIIPPHVSTLRIEIESLEWSAFRIDATLVNCRSLRIPNNDDVTELDLLTHEHLEKLYVGRCSQLTDLWVPKKIDALTITKCDRLCNIRTKHTRLRSLVVADCPFVEQDKFPSTISNLYVSHCPCMVVGKLIPYTSLTMVTFHVTDLRWVRTLPSSLEVLRVLSTPSQPYVLTKTLVGLSLTMNGDTISIIINPDVLTNLIIFENPEKE